MKLFQNVRFYLTSRDRQIAELKDKLNQAHKLEWYQKRTIDKLLAAVASLAKDEDHINRITRHL